MTTDTFQAFGHDIRKGDTIHFEGRNIDVVHVTSYDGGNTIGLTLSDETSVFSIAVNGSDMFEVTR